jgi:hypothetical protein
MSELRFNIYSAYVIYGGSLGGSPGFRLMYENVNSEHVFEFLKNVEPLIKQFGVFKTKDDSMGCYHCYKVEVSNLDKLTGKGES